GGVAARDVESPLRASALRQDLPGVRHLFLSGAVCLANLSDGPGGDSQIPAGANDHETVEVHAVHACQPEGHQAGQDLFPGTAAYLPIHGQVAGVHASGPWEVASRVGLVERAVEGCPVAGRWRDELYLPRTAGHEAQGRDRQCNRHQSTHGRVLRSGWNGAFVSLPAGWRPPRETAACGAGAAQRTLPRVILPGPMTRRGARGLWGELVARLPPCRRTVGAAPSAADGAAEAPSARARGCRGKRSQANDGTSRIRKTRPLSACRAFVWRIGTAGFEPATP